MRRRVQCSNKSCRELAYQLSPSGRLLVVHWLFFLHIYQKKVGGSIHSPSCKRIQCNSKLRYQVLAYISWRPLISHCFNGCPIICKASNYTFKGVVSSTYMMRSNTVSLTKFNINANHIERRVSIVLKCVIVAAAAQTNLKCIDVRRNCIQVSLEYSAADNRMAPLKYTLLVTLISLCMGSSCYRWFSYVC